MLTEEKLAMSVSGPNPFAEAIFSLIEELRESENKNSLFYKQVLEVGYRLSTSNDYDDESCICAENLSSYIHDLEHQNLKKSRTRKLLTFAQPLVEGLMQYTAAMDVMIQGGPAISSLIYGGAKLILQLANGYTKSFEEIVQMMADIGVQLKYFEIYTRQFASNEYMNGLLCSSYREILYFWRDASKVLSQKGTRVLLRGVLVPFKEKYLTFKKKLDNNAQNVRNMAAALHIEAQGNFTAVQSAQIQGILTSVKKLGAHEGPSRLSGKGFCEALQESSSPVDFAVKLPTTSPDHDRIRKWISGGRFSRIDPQPDLDKHLRSRTHGTCRWLLDEPVFLDWYSSKENASLWINAAPGAGKSVLAASIIENHIQSPNRDARNIIYFFCRFDDPDKSRAISALRSLAFQALKLIKHVPDDLWAIYEEEFSPEDSYMASVQMAEKVLGCLLKRIEYVSIIIDGLDECQDSAPQSQLLESLVRLREGKTYGIVKWLYTSRDDAVISRYLGSSGCQVLNVPKVVTQGDIRIFLEDNGELWGGSSDQIDRMVKLTQGNFLMLRLTVDPFRNEELTCSEEFEEALENFQPELGRCWLRSLERLLSKSPQIQELARILLATVIVAIQPMTFNELLELTSIKIGEQESAQRKRTKSIILSACTPFLEVDYESDFINPVVRLAHKSIGDLLTQEPSRLEYVGKGLHKFFVESWRDNAALGLRCLTYLGYDRYSGNPQKHDTEITPAGAFLKYAAVYWYKHLNIAEISDEHFKMVQRFLRSSNFWTCICVQSKYAPFIFSRLSYDAAKDFYFIGAERSLLQPPGISKSDSAQDYYADALPSWLGKFGKEGEDLVWAHHMFVREWGELIVKYSGDIRPYFAQTLGGRGFWFYHNSGMENVEIHLGEELEMKKAEPFFSNTHMSCRKVAGAEDGDDPLSQYAKKILGSSFSSYRKTASITTTFKTVTAEVRRYKISNRFEGDNLDDEDECDTSSQSDEDTDKEDNSCMSPKQEQPAVAEFLSIKTANGEIRNLHTLLCRGERAVFQLPTPLFNDQATQLLWPHSETTLAIVDTETWNTTIVNLPKPHQSNYLLIAQDYRYSSSSQSLEQVTVHHLDSEAILITHSSFPLEVLPSPSKQPSRAFNVLASHSESWTLTNTSFKLPLSFCWTEFNVYLAVGWPAVNLFRLPIDSREKIETPGYATQPLQLYQEHLCIPATAYSRGLSFTINKPKDSDSFHAIFSLEAASELELPAVILDFRLSEEKWGEFDPKLMDVGFARDVNKFWKGSYASKDKKFTIPIRSGMDWRRALDVSCW